MEKELKRVSVVPMRGMVLFPHMTLNFDAAREMSIKALESAAENDSIVFLAAQKDYTIEQPTVDEYIQYRYVCGYKTGYAYARRYNKSYSKGIGTWNY